MFGKVDQILIYTRVTAGECMHSESIACVHQSGR